MDELHAVPAAACPHVMTDDFAIANRDKLEQVLGDAECAEAGPYTTAMTRLLRENRPAIRRLLNRCDELVERNTAEGTTRVITHGEPHPANTMLTADGWMLVDWDTVLLAPPERDLWQLGADGPRPALLEQYRIAWDLTDAAVYVDRFLNPHTGNEDDDKSWAELRRLVDSGLC